MAQLRAASRNKNLPRVFGKDSSDHPAAGFPRFSPNRRKAVVLLLTTFHPLHSLADASTAEFARQKVMVLASQTRGSFERLSFPFAPDSRT